MGHGIIADLWTTRYDEMKSIMVQPREQLQYGTFLTAKPPR
jgi:hypothetical protein